MDDDDIAHDNGVHIDVCAPSTFIRCGDTWDGEPVFALVDSGKKVTHLKPVK